MKQSIKVLFLMCFFIGSATVIKAQQKVIGINAYKNIGHYDEKYETHLSQFGYSLTANTGVSIGVYYDKYLSERFYIRINPSITYKSLRFYETLDAQAFDQSNYLHVDLVGFDLDFIAKMDFHVKGWNLTPSLGLSGMYFENTSSSYHNGPGKEANLAIVTHIENETEFADYHQFVKAGVLTGLDIGRVGSAVSFSVKYTYSPFESLCYSYKIPFQPDTPVTVPGRFKFISLGLNVNLY